MKKSPTVMIIKRVAGALATGAVLSSTVVAAAPGGNWQSSPTASTECVLLNGVAETTTSAGVTNGVFGSYAVGDLVTVTVSMVTATSSTVTIVGGPSGTPVLAGPLTGPGTLSYLVTGPLPTGSVGIGYFVASTTPADGTVRVRISCTDAPRSIPAWSLPVGMSLAGGLALLAAGALRRKRNS